MRNGCDSVLQGYFRGFMSTIQIPFSVGKLKFTYGRFLTALSLNILVRLTQKGILGSEYKIMGLETEIMRIKKISIRNYRSIKKQDISCCGYNVFVGPNGSGKSTILQALNLFFGEHKSITEDDFTDRDTSNPIEVELTFDSFSEDAKKRV